VGIGAGLDGSAIEKPHDHQQGLPQPPGVPVSTPFPPGILKLRGHGIDGFRILATCSQNRTLGDAFWRLLTFQLGEIIGITTVVSASHSRGRGFDPHQLH
jgi:hypothetical protein